MSATLKSPRATLGWLGFDVGSAALILTMAIFWAGPFAPQQSAGVTLGELAAEMAKSAARSVAGQPQPEPIAPTRTIDDYLQMGVAVLAGLSIILGIAGLIRHEQHRAAVSGITLGVLAVGFQLFTWAVMMVAGAIIIMGLVYAMRDAFGDMFGGLFSG